MQLKNSVKNFNLTGGLKPFFILALLSGVFPGCENDIEKVSIITDKQALPVETSTGLEILYSDSAMVKVKITTPKLERFDGESPVTELPDGVFVEFFDQNMNVSSTLKSDYAIRKDDEQIMEARSNVVVINERGEQLNTEHLVWNEITSKIYSDEFVKITTSDKIIFGNGFEANQDFTNYKIFKIKGTISINKDEHTEDS